VRSILLISKVPLAKIRSVATDDSSRTSAALVEIFLRKFAGLDPGIIRQKPNLEEMLRWHDAALLIGDPALKAQTKGYYAYDLAESGGAGPASVCVCFWAVRKAALQNVPADIDIPRIFQHRATTACSTLLRLLLPGRRDWSCKKR